MSKLKRYFSFIFVVAISLFMLTSCDNQELSNRIETTINNMLPNIYVTLAQLAVFILTALIFIKFAYKPIKKKLNQRSEYIENNIKQAEIKNQEAQQKVEKANSLILSSEQKAAEIIQQAQTNRKKFKHIKIFNKLIRRCLNKLNKKYFKPPSLLQKTSFKEK